MERRLLISECTFEDVLAEDILNDYGAVLLPAGTAINPYILHRLSQIGIEHITVFERKSRTDSSSAFHAFEKQYKDHAVKIKDILNQMASGKKIQHTEIKSLVNAIIAMCDEPDYVSRCLCKIRNADDYTYYHSVNVSFYAMLVAGWMKLSKSQLKEIVLSGLLHDLGKVRIPAGILNKPGKLSAEEFDEIKRHTLYGYELLNDDPQISPRISEAVLMHHEREDQSGYPFCAGSRDLSLHTKIIAAADVYDAMISTRPYKQAKTPFEAFEEMYALCRSKLDVRVIDTLLANLPRYYVGSKVLLSNGQTGNIAYIPQHCLWKPIVDTGTEFLDLAVANNITIAAMI